MVPLISVVDDDLSIRKSLDRLMRSAGLQVNLFACSLSPGELPACRNGRPTGLPSSSPQTVPDIPGFSVHL